MNCANHPDRPATAFCQGCGKPLCHECTRTFEGLLLCEPDFAARQAGTPGAPPPPVPGYRPVGWTPPSGSNGAGSYAAQPIHTSPVLAALLGIIPGVGAMYNGQFIKALLHVVVFIVLVGTTEHFGLAAFLIAAWVFYQVFDAAQTASARRDGRPLPDPFGILDMSQRLGPQGGPQNGAPQFTPAPYPYKGAPQDSQNTQKSAFSDVKTGPYAPPQGAPSEPVEAGKSQGTGYAGSYPPAQPYTTVPAPPQPAVSARRGEPVGAIVLIVVGLLFLMSTLGFLNIGWLARGWPVLVLLLGVWLLIRRVNAPDPAMPPSGGIAPAPYPGAAADRPGTGRPATGMVQGNPLSITGQRAVVEGEGSASRTEDEEK